MRVLDRRAIWPTLILIMGALSWCADRSGPNQDGSQLREVQKMWGEVPLYEGFKEVDRSESSRGTSVRVERYYQSNAESNEVVGFYSNWLNRHGWALKKERKLNDWGRDLGGLELDFRKGDFTLDLTYAGERANYGWNYVIGINWDAP